MSGVYRISGPPNVHRFKQISGGTTATFKTNDLVTVHATTGDLVIASAAHIGGIALQNAPGDVTTDVLVDVISADDSEFVMAYGSTTAVTNRGKNCDVTFTTQTISCVDGSGSGDFVIVDLDGRDAVGASGGRVIGRFLAGSLDLSKGLA